MNIQEIIKENSLNSCIEAYNRLNLELQCDDDIVYHYDTIMELYVMRLQALSKESFKDTQSFLENLLIDFVHIGREYSYSTIQDSYFVYNGYGNLEIITEDTIREYLYDLIVNNFNKDELEDKLEELFLI